LFLGTRPQRRRTLSLSGSDGELEQYIVLAIIPIDANDNNNGNITHTLNQLRQCPTTQEIVPHPSLLDQLRRRFRPPQTDHA